MAYYWLNQKNSDESNYHDKVGEVYHYRENTPGANQLGEGDRFVYYRPGDHELFGAGKIERIEKKENSLATESGIPNNYFAYISDYRPFEPPLRLKGVGEHKVKDKISFLRSKPGLAGVPQHSIHEISEKDFIVILEAVEQGSNIVRLLLG